MNFNQPNETDKSISIINDCVISSSNNNRAGSARDSLALASVSTIKGARRLKYEKEAQARQRCQRISIMQAEEEKAVKKIHETRTKAMQMLEFKLQNEQMAKERIQ